MTSLSGRQFSGPQYEQLSLPGMGEGGSEQMRLFDTHRAGPASLYTANPSLDASDWRDQDKQVPLNEDEQTIVDDDEYGVSGEFFRFPIGQQDREFMANAGAFTRARSEFDQAGNLLGHDAYPEKTQPDLQFRDLVSETSGYMEAQQSYFTDEGTEVGRVQWHDDEWGPNVDYAEINPMFRGRGFSREAITGFARDVTEGGDGGIVHAGAYTTAGGGAFHAKGIPTVDEIEGGYEDWVGGLDVDDDEIRQEAEYRYPEEDWGSPDAPQSYLDEIHQDLLVQKEDDPDNRRMFRENLEDMQEQVLANLPSGRKSSFAQGWKPKGPTFGRDEELPDMPQKYTGAFEG